jgi:hypothetical protein
MKTDQPCLGQFINKLRKIFPKKAKVPALEINIGQIFSQFFCRKLT